MATAGAIVKCNKRAFVKPSPASLRKRRLVFKSSEGASAWRGSRPISGASAAPQSGSVLAASLTLATAESHADIIDAASSDIAPAHLRGQPR